MNSPVRVIAFYLPQFHPIPENDAWWGKGFTEWTNVSRAKPLFDSHYQPRQPADLGFYDLRLAEVREAQASLAREYGIHGFCYHYYWFKGGRRLLERPLDELLASRQPDFPFCLCWANENWTRRWDGQESEVLMAQEHCAESDLDFLHSVLPIFRDPRYIRVDGRPLLIVYRATLFPDLAATVRRWQEESCRLGELPPYLVAAETFDVSGGAVVAAGFNATCEFPPHGAGSASINNEVISTFRGPYSGTIFDYNRVVDLFLSKPEPPFRRFQTVTLNWDNTARKKSGGTITVNFSLESYHRWLSGAIKRSERTVPDDERIVFINAWNEWAEGTYLEPDQLYGHAYLEATRAAIGGEPYAFRASAERSVPATSDRDDPEMASSAEEEALALPRGAASNLTPARFRIIAVAMVGNEADIVEAFVRENLNFVDKMLIACHHPLDSTTEILEKLAAEGLPIHVEAIDALESNKVETVRGLVQQAIEIEHADWIVPLDADEFLDAPSREFLETQLANSSQTHLWLPWINHVPTAFDNEQELNPIRRIRHRYVYPCPSPQQNVWVWKVILNTALIKSYLDRYDLTKGAHRLVFKGSNHPCHQPISVMHGLQLRHFPVRSYEQLILKVGLGRLGRQLQGGFQSTGGLHWDHIWSEIGAGRKDIGILQFVVREYLDTGRFNAEQLKDTPIVLDPMPAQCELLNNNARLPAPTVIYHLLDKYVQNEP